MDNKPEYNYCDIVTRNGNHKFLAKVKTSMQKDGTSTFGPSEVLVEGVWRPIKEFAVHWPNFSCDNYRQTEQEEPLPIPKKDVTDIEITKPTDTTITTTFTPQAWYGDPKIFASTDFNAPAFGTRIQLYRESLILSRRKAAAQMNINESAVAAIEAGTYHGIDEIAKAAKWANLTASEMGAFFGLEDPKKPERSWSGTPIILILLFILTWILVWNL
jgi:hypothetical protein